MNHRDLRTDSLREEPKLEHLIEARERTDAGVRLALPLLAERIGIGSKEPTEPEGKAPVDHATATAVGTKLLDAHKAVMEAADALPLDGHGDLHLGLNGLVNEIDRIACELAERWGSE